jgi:hypothetical protein
MGTGPLAFKRSLGLILTDKENSTFWHDYRISRMNASETRTIITEAA